MTEERVERRLAAIFVADVVGYSALIRADEEGTRAMRLVHFHAGKLGLPFIERSIRHAVLAAQLLGRKARSCSFKTPIICSSVNLRFISVLH